MKVKDCMCKEVVLVKPECDTEECARVMCENHIGCIPVCDDNNCICGIVTDRDIILRCVACNKDTNQTPASDIMTCNVTTCKQEHEMTNAQTKMEQKQIRRLPVCDSNNQVVGILTLGDLAHFDTKLGKQQVCTTFENICNCEGQIKNGN